MNIRALHFTVSPDCLYLVVDNYGDDSVFHAVRGNQLVNHNPLGCKLVEISHHISCSCLDKG